MRRLHKLRGVGYWKYIHKDPVPLHKGHRFVGQGRRLKAIYTYGDSEKGETLTVMDNEPPAYTAKPRCKGANRSCFIWAAWKRYPKLFRDV